MHTMRSTDGPTSSVGRHNGIPGRGDCLDPTSSSADRSLGRSRYHRDTKEIPPKQDIRRVDEAAITYGRARLDQHRHQRDSEGGATVIQVEGGVRSDELFERHQADAEDP